MGLKLSRYVTTHQSPLNSTASFPVGMLYTRADAQPLIVLSLSDLAWNRKKNHEAEIENTHGYGQAGKNHRLWQNYAPQGRFQPFAPQQVSSFYSFDG